MQFLYRSAIFRIIMSLSRYIIFNFFGKFKTFYNSKDKNVSNMLIFENGKTSLEHNLVYRNLPIKFNIKQLKKKLLQFSGKKVELLIYPLKAIDFVNFSQFKVLSIGPRVESELMTIRSMGFKWKNIKAIDIHTYSNLIELGDMHAIKYEHNYFDVVISGWTLAYSTNVKLALSEILRVCKPGGLILIGFTYDKNLENHPHLNSNRKEEKIYTTDQIKEFFKDNIQNVYFEFDAYKDNPNVARHSIIIIRTRKRKN